MEYTIVPMDRSHVGQIAELERECFSAPWSEAMLTEALFDAQASFIVAESEPIIPVAPTNFQDFSCSFPLYQTERYSLVRLYCMIV